LQKDHIKRGLFAEFADIERIHGVEMLIVDRILEYVRSIRVPVEAAAFKRWLFWFPEALLALAGLPAFFLFRILLEPSLLKYPGSLLLALSISFTVIVAAGLLCYFRSRKDVDSYFEQLNNLNAWSEQQRAQSVNRMLQIPFRFTLNLSVRITLLAMLTLAIRFAFIDASIYDSIRFIAQILISASFIIFVLLAYHRLIIGNLLNATQFLKAPVHLLQFNKLRQIVSFSVFLALGFFTGWLILVIKVTGGYSLFQEELKEKEGLRTVLQMQLNQRLEVMEAQCVQTRSLIDRDATDEEIRQQLKHPKSPTLKYIVRWADGIVRGSSLTLPAPDQWKGRSFFIDVVYENDKALLLAACPGKNTAAGLIYDGHGEFSLIQAALPSGLHIVLAREDGTIAFHPDTSLIGKSFASLEDAEFSGDEGKPQVVYYHEDNVDRVLIGPHQGGPLSVLLLTDAKHLEKNVDHLLFYISLVMFPLALAFSAGMHLLLFFNLGSVRSLKDQVTRLAEGDLQAHIEYITGDSLGQLSLHLNELIEKLQSIANQTRFTIGLILRRNQQNLLLTEENRQQFQAISATVEEIATSSTEILTTVEEVDQKTQHQIGNIDQYLQAIEKLTVTIGKMNETVNQLNSLYNSTRSEASIGRTLLKDLKDAMRSLDDRANQIEGIVGFINDISKQVNLLALNASIEAARAGEAGRGFAVVADEVSRLADRISESVKNISSLVQGNREESKRGFENATEAARLFNRVLVDMNTINDVIDEIAKTRNDLSLTNQFVAERNNEINEIVKFIYANSKEQKSALNEIGIGLNTVMKAVTGHLSQNEKIHSEAATLLGFTGDLKEILQFFTETEQERKLEASLEALDNGALPHEDDRNNP